MLKEHTIPPFYRENSEILILGSFPSPKSRESGFYYGHPQNRFWRVISAVFGENLPQTIDEKSDFLERRQIALWDVLASCEIHGAEDSSIKNEVPNDISEILNHSPIRRIFTTGGTAYRLYRKYLLPQCNIDAYPLPSTSPANCRVSLEALIEQYKVIKERA